MKSRNNNIDFKEVYSQRYQTYRYLDRLKWTMMQIGVTTSSVIFIVSGDNSNIGWITYFGTGFILLFTSLSMFRIMSGIIKNSKMLNIAGQNIGDSFLPVLSKDKKTISFFISSIMLVAGIFLIIYSILCI
ncbi:hypothetical protein HOB87_11060 [Candidatus Woesearchaeota archaeon]|nr:hypothetical protein [Candidatus Woesearchaeota archaeon]